MVKDSDITIQQKKISDIATLAQYQRMQAHLLKKSGKDSEFEYLNLVATGPSGEILGSIMGWKNYDYSSIEMIWVEEGFQKKGLGKKLVDEFAKLSKKLNCEAMLVSSHSHSDGKEFWIKSGFTLHSQVTLSRTELFYYKKSI